MIRTLMCNEYRLTKISIDLTVPSRHRRSDSIPSCVMDARKASSNIKGTIRTDAKGQPIVLPKPNHMMPCAVFEPNRQSRNAAVPSMEVYIAKLDGR